MDIASLIVNAIDPAKVISDLLTRASEKAGNAKENYSIKLEAATGDDVFKYVLLINMAALEGYIAQTRLQAAQSFRLSRIVAMIGFMLWRSVLGLVSIYLRLERARLKCRMWHLEPGF